MPGKHPSGIESSETTRIIGCMVDEGVASQGPSCLLSLFLCPLSSPSPAFTSTMALYRSYILYKQNEVLAGRQEREPERNESPHPSLAYLQTTVWMSRLSAFVNKYKINLFLNIRGPFSFLDHLNIPYIPEQTGNN